MNAGAPTSPEENSTATQPDGNDDRIRSLVLRPGESLNCEIKTWLDPTQDEHQVILVRAMLALRNQDGGELVLGFDDKTLLPDPLPPGVVVELLYHADKLQSLVGRYASESFEVKVQYVERNGVRYPVISVPSGVRTPVAAKSDLKPANSRKGIATNDVYVRTLAANNTVSSAKILYQDWPPLIGRCFDNREADIGGFVRRQLQASTPEALRAAFAGLLAPVEDMPPNAWRGELIAIADQGAARSLEAIAEQGYDVPDIGWWEVTARLIGPLASREKPPTQEFLTTLAISNPKLNGWPVWLDSRVFIDPEFRPKTRLGKWEALIFDIAGARVYKHVDFMEMDPNGVFYLRRGLQEDLAITPPVKGKVFDVNLPILRCAEAIATILAFGNALGGVPEQTEVEIVFRWSGLRGRELSLWADATTYFAPIPYSVASDDRVAVFRRMPIDTPKQTIPAVVSSMLGPLYAVFDGYQYPPNGVEYIAQQLLGLKRN